MSSTETVINPIERRQYKRLPTFYRVDFNIVRLQGDLPGIDWQVGSTEDIGKSGMCLYAKSLTLSTFKYIKNNNIYLNLHINAPLLSAPIKAVGEVMWFKENRSTFMVGILFRSIDNQKLRVVIGETRFFDWIITLLLAASTVLFISLIFWQLFLQLSV